MRSLRALTLAAALTLGVVACHPHDANPRVDYTRVGRVVTMRNHDWGHGVSWYIEIVPPGSGPPVWLVVTETQWRGCREYPHLWSLWDRDHCRH